MEDLELNRDDEVIIAKEEVKKDSLEAFLENLENEIDNVTDEVKVEKLGSQLARVRRGENYLDFKLTMSYGDKQNAKALNKADSILYDEGGDSKIEMKLKDNDLDMFLLEKQIVDSNLGKLNRIAISENETHLELFEAAVEIIKMKNGLVQTKKQIEKKKAKKA